MDPRIASYLEQNKKWAERPDYKPPISFKEMQKRGREREDGTVIVVACTDPRVTPEEFLGMDGNTKATVVRTAGGRVAAALNTLLVLAAVGNNGKKGVIMVVHHTDCGLAHVEGDEEIAIVLKEGLNSSEDTETEREFLDGLEFGSFRDPEDSVKEDVKLLKHSPFFKGVQILGFVQDTETGVLKEIIGV